MSLKEERIKAGYSTQSFAKAIGVSPAAINRYELGKRTPKVPIAKKMANVLGIDWWVLIDNKKAG